MVRGLAKQNNVDIVTADVPRMFASDASPAESFMRRIMLAVAEFERDTIVARLSSGLQRAKATTKRKTQYGRPKANGRTSILETTKPNSLLKRRLLCVFARRRKGTIGWREAAKQLGCLLNRDIAVETARRMEVELKFL